MLTVEDLIALQDDAVPVPYLTGEEAKLVVQEIRALRSTVELLEEKCKWAWYQGAAAMQAQIVARLAPSYDTGAAGLARSLSPEDVENALKQEG